jgi:radical SAM protein with 4Fe4S-binding SPASM domain
MTLFDKLINLELKAMHEISKSPISSDICYYIRRKIDPYWRLSRLSYAYILSKRQHTQYNTNRFRIDSTTICNARCIFCAYPRTQQKHEHISIDVLSKGLDLAKSLGINHIEYCPTLGDPFTDLDLDTKIKYLVVRGFTWMTSTNCIKLGDNLDWLLSYLHPTEIHLSLPQNGQKEYLNTYGVDSYEQAYKNAISFLLNNQREGEPIIVRIAIRNREKPSFNKSTFDIFKPYLSKRVTMEFTPLWDSWNGKIEINAWTKYMKQGLYWNPIINRPCQIMNVLAIRPNGDVLACGCRAMSDDLKVGTINDNVEILKIKALEMKNGFYKGQFPNTCKQCSYYRPEP